MLDSSPFLPRSGFINVNPMEKYEGLFIFPPDESPEAGKQEERQIEEILRRFGGRVLERKDWGRRPLGYSVRKFREGRVLVWNFEIEAAQMGELFKALHLDEKILKTTIVKPQEPKREKVHAGKS